MVIMKTHLALSLLAAVAVTSLPGAQQPWQQLSNPTAAEAAKIFAAPPPEYSATTTWGWNGPMTEEVIVRDLDTIHARGLRIVTIEAGYHMDDAPYITDAWFKRVRFAAEEAAKRGMRLIVIDEGKYPSGFANGKFSQERPDLRMQGLAVAERIAVAAGETFARELAPEVVGVIALNADNGESRLVDAPGRKLSFTAPAEGKWQLIVVDHQFRTGDTRAVNDPTQAKTTKNAMGDLLNPAAVRQWMEWTHEGYKRHMGDLFGKVVLAFRGDEPDFAYTPWNDTIAAEFQRRKGYDVRPYLPFFASFPRNAGGLKLTDEQKRAKADYWDVWSDLFAVNFFKQQADWCAANGVEYTVHLNNDHDMFGHVRASGDFFKSMRYVQIPGIDVIWSQIYPGKAAADFPKFASSAAHVYGHPRALSESYAAFYDPVTVEVARWGVNEQLARGITLFEFMFTASSATRVAPPAAAQAPANAGQKAAAAPAAATSAAAASRYMADPEFPALAAYTQRMQYLLSQGRPAAQIAVYMPTTSFWLGDQEANASMVKISQQLLEAQRDFDYVDEQALIDMMSLKGGEFTNLSGQVYRAVIIPSVTAISKAALERLRSFASAGGKVIVLGRSPALAIEKTFLHAGAPGDLSWTTLWEKSGEVTPAVLAQLPAPEVALDAAAPALKYSHRRLRDADVYFFFNEGEQPVARNVTLATKGTAEAWDAQTGRAEPLAGASASGEGLRLPLSLGRYEAKVVVVKTPAAVAALN
jgi:hypothetical protein